MGERVNVQGYMANVPGELRDVAEKALAVIDAGMPGVEAALWHGHPTWSLGDKPGQKPVCFLKTYAKYVTFGFWKGQEIEDASGRLESMSRQMAGVKLRTPADIDPALFATWLNQARALEG